MSIKGRRRERVVPVLPGGVVADYVPFYFAPRSPMMFAISRGNVATYADGTRPLIYLATTVERLQAHGLEVLFSDRNAVLTLADFANLGDGDPGDDFVDWPLMRETYWYPTPDYPDREERRMAECLVYGSVPWEVFNGVATRDSDTANRVRQVLEAHHDETKVDVRPHWYF